MNNKSDNEAGVCMLLDESNYTCDVLSTERGEQGFLHFVVKSISALVPGHPAPEWLFVYFNQPEILKRLSEIKSGDTPEFINVFEQFQGKKGMGPVYSLSLPNALYCLKNDIPLLSVDARSFLLDLRPGYGVETEQIKTNVPDLSEKLGRLAAGYQYPDMEPMDLYLLGAKGGKILGIGHGKGDDGFRDFMFDQLATKCKPGEPLPEAVFIQVKMQSQGNIPALEMEDMTKYLLLRFGAGLDRSEEEPIFVGIWDAVYCIHNDIPLLSDEAQPDALHKRSDYNMDSFMASIAAPDISEKLAELRKSADTLRAPTIVVPERKSLRVK